MDPGVRRRSPCSCLRGMNVDFSCRSAVWPPIPVRDRSGWGIIMLQPFGWPTPPLLSGSWHEIDPDLAREFRDLLVSSQIRCTPLVYAGAMRRYRVRPLAFWPGWMWVDALVDTKQGAASAAFLYGPYGEHELDGTSALIHDVNEGGALRSEEHTYELQSLMRNSYAVFCLKKNTT